MNAHEKARWIRTVGLDDKPNSRVTARADSAGGKAGRRKGKVQELFESQGADAAWVLGLRLGLKESTLRTWFAGWRTVSKAGSQRYATVHQAGIAASYDLALRDAIYL
jgi:hypothetical protein